MEFKYDYRSFKQVEYDKVCVKKLHEKLKPFDKITLNYGKKDKKFEFTATLV